MRCLPIVVMLLACGSKKDDETKRVDPGPPAKGSAAPAEKPPAEKPAAPASLPALAKAAAPGKAYVAVEHKGIFVIDGGKVTRGPSLPEEHDEYVRRMWGTADALYLEVVGSIYKVAGGKATLVAKQGPGMLGPTVVPAPDGSVWGFTIASVAHWDGKAWTAATKNDELGSGGFQGLAIGGDGTVWLAAHKQLYKRDGEAWTKVDRPALANELISALVAASDGKVYAVHGSKLVEITAPDAKDVDLGGYAIGVEIAAGPEGRIALVGMHDEVDVLVPPATLVHVTGKTKGGAGGKHAIAYDGGGRIWVAGNDGMFVIDAAGGRTDYATGTLGELSGRIGGIVIEGAGPELPAVGEVARGRVKGTLATDGGKAIAGATVEICANTRMMMRAGETPCSGEKFTKSMATDADGGFAFDDVPVGTWGFAVLVPGKDKWSITMHDYCRDMKKGDTCNAQIVLR